MTQAGDLVRNKAMYTQQSKIGPRPAHGAIVKVLTIRHEATCGRANGYEECTCTPVLVPDPANGPAHPDSEVKDDDDSD